MILHTNPQPKLSLPILSIFFVLFLGASAITGPRNGHVPPLSANQFASVINRVSEDGGNFWNDNFVSNEASYLHPLNKMEELGIRGGVYIGVGPDQNFTYIAKIQPRYAFIVDIRRQNLLEHLLFKSLFHLAHERSQYLSFLLSRPIAEGEFPDDKYTVEDLVQYFKTAQPDPAFFNRIQKHVHLFLMNCGLELSEQDWNTIRRIHTAFYSRGLSIKYDYIPVPTYGEFLVEKDLDGKMQNFLNSNDDYRYVRTMEEENRILPIVGDFAGPHAIRELGAYLKENNEKVTIFYTSNVEQYLVRSMIWPEFIHNLNSLPFDDRAIFIRAHWNIYTPHPDEVEGYQFTQILQWIKVFLQRVHPSTSTSYWDIVTADTIKLR